MKALAIIVLAGLGFWFLTVDLGILSFGIACLIGWMIQKDRGDDMMNDFFAIMGGLALVGVLLTVLGF